MANTKQSSGPAPSAADKAAADKKAAERLEAKKATFHKLANKRVNKALDAIANVGKLASYKGGYTAEQVAAIEKYMNAELDSCLKVFQAALSGGKTSAGKFNL